MSNIKLRIHIDETGRPMLAIMLEVGDLLAAIWKATGINMTGFTSMIESAVSNMAGRFGNQGDPRKNPRKRRASGESEEDFG